MLFESLVSSNRLKQHTFPAVKAEKVRITFLHPEDEVRIADSCVYSARKLSSVTGSKLRM